MLFLARSSARCRGVCAYCSLKQICWVHIYNSLIVFFFSLDFFFFPLPFHTTFLLLEACHGAVVAGGSHHLGQEQGRWGVRGAAPAPCIRHLHSSPTQLVSLLRGQSQSCTAGSCQNGPWTTRNWAPRKAGDHCANLWVTRRWWLPSSFSPPVLETCLWKYLLLWLGAL